MRNRYLKLIIFGFTTLLVISSCAGRHQYERPNDVVNENLFRTDLLPKDSTSLADISWKEFFTDATLQKHIDEALSNNLDIRVALQNIVSAESYLKQSKAAYQPTLSVVEIILFLRNRLIPSLVKLLAKDVTSISLILPQVSVGNWIYGVN